MSSTATPYSRQWRASVRAGARSSAAVIAPMLHELYHPERVIDVGCGEGWFGAAFSNLLVPVVDGVDGPWVDASYTVDFATANPYPELGPYHLALCLEVAEHIPAERAADFVAWLCTLAPVIAFSAAIPGQGGEGHVNEQWPAYWADLFAEHGRAGTGALRWRLWDDHRVEWWYAQNLLIFATGPTGTGLPGDGCPAVVHPGMWMHHHP